MAKHVEAIAIPRRVNRVSWIEGGLELYVAGVGDVTIWTCGHEHHSRQRAKVCAWQARGIARAGGLLPEATPVAWTEWDAKAL